MKKNKLTITLIFSLFLLLGSSMQTLSFQLIVCGSDPEGIASAVSAARNGVNTALVCKRTKLGGLMTVGALNTIDMNYGPRGEVLTQGIFMEFFTAVEGDSFDIRTAEKTFQQMVDHPNITLFLGAQNIKPVLWDQEVIGVSFNYEGESRFIPSLTVIDATQDANIAYQAGVDFTIGLEDFGGPTHGMGATLIFGVNGVNWEELTSYLRRNRVPDTGFSNTSAWGFWQQMQNYQPQDPYIRMRGLNLGRQADNSVLINAMYIFDFYHLSSEQRTEAIKRGTEELNYLIPFLKDNIPGFAKAQLSYVAEELYIRETRHMQGLYRLTIDDVLEHRNFEDKIALGSYPVDIQDISLQQRGFIVGNPVIYSIPFRCIVPQNIENLLVVGRSASYDSLPHGSTRVIPVGMAVGEAAGLSVALLEDYIQYSWQELADNQDFIQALQQGLQAQGAYLPDFDIPHPLLDHYAYSGVKRIRSLGLISSGYNNNYNLEELMTPLALQNIFNSIIARLYQGTIPYAYVSHHQNPIEITELMRLFLSIWPLKENKPPITAAYHWEFIPANLPNEIDIDKPLTRGDVYYFLDIYLEKLLKIMPPPNKVSP